LVWVVTDGRIVREKVGGWGVAIAEAIGIMDPTLSWDLLP
jgi:hypothetical protein